MNQNKLIKKEETAQLKLGIKTSKAGFFYKTKKKFEELEIRLEVMPFWKHFIFISFGVLSIVVPGSISSILMYKYTLLPDKMPFFFDTSTNSWLLLDKGFIMPILIFFAVINLILLNIIHSIYYYDRRLAKIIAITGNIYNILLFISFSQILTILLI